MHRIDQPLGLAISERVGLILSDSITLSAILLGTFQFYRKFRFLSYAAVSGPEKGPLGGQQCPCYSANPLLVTGSVFGDSLSTLRDGMLG